MKLKLLPKRDEEKTVKSFALYRSLADDLERICTEEGFKFSHLMRHLINNFIAAYVKK